ncbi:hypothetical protein HK101_011678 [Irineochytrium annulatum]|nr:hypothetical protein HK101_011678 [Irineochytrium annulatum]
MDGKDAAAGLVSALNGEFLAKLLAMRTESDQLQQSQKADLELLEEKQKEVKNLRLQLVALRNISEGLERASRGAAPAEPAELPVDEPIEPPAEAQVEDAVTSQPMPEEAAVADTNESQALKQPSTEQEAVDKEQTLAVAELLLDSQRALKRFERLQEQQEEISVIRDRIAELKERKAAMLKEIVDSEMDASPDMERAIALLKSIDMDDDDEEDDIDGGAERDGNGEAERDDDDDGDENDGDGMELNENYARDLHDMESRLEKLKERQMMLQGKVNLLETDSQESVTAGEPTEPAKEVKPAEAQVEPPKEELDSEIESTVDSLLARLVASSVLERLEASKAKQQQENQNTAARAEEAPRETTEDDRRKAYERHLEMQQSALVERLKKSHTTAQSPAGTGDFEEQQGSSLTVAQEGATETSEIEEARLALEEEEDEDEDDDEASIQANSLSALKFFAETDRSLQTTSDEIEEGIKQLVAHIQEAEQEQAEHSGPEHLGYFANLFRRLSGHLEELMAARDKVIKYRALLHEQQEHVLTNLKKSLEADAAGPGTLASPEERPQELRDDSIANGNDRAVVEEASEVAQEVKAAAIVNPPSEDRESPDIDREEDHDNARGFARSRFVYGEIPAAAESYVESPAPNDVDVGGRAANQWTEEAQGDMLFTTDHERKLSEGLRNAEPGPNSLFGKVKDSIYRGAASTISKFEDEPYFLLQLFRNVQKLDQPEQRQRLMIALDGIVENDLDDAGEVDIVEAKHREMYDATPGRNSIDVSENILKSLTKAAPVAKDSITNFVTKVVVDPSLASEKFTVRQIATLKKSILDLLALQIDSACWNQILQDMDLTPESEEMMADHIAIPIDPDLIADLVEASRPSLDALLDRFIGLDVNRTKRALQNEAMSLVSEIIEQSVEVALSREERDKRIEREEKAVQAEVDREMEAMMRYGGRRSAWAAAMEDEEEDEDVPSYRVHKSRQPMMSPPARGMADGSSFRDRFKSSTWSDSAPTRRNVPANLKMPSNYESYAVNYADTLPRKAARNPVPGAVSRSIQPSPVPSVASSTVASSTISARYRPLAKNLIGESDGEGDLTVVGRGARWSSSSSSAATQAERAAMIATAEQPRSRMIPGERPQSATSFTRYRDARQAEVGRRVESSRPRAQYRVEGIKDAGGWASRPIRDATDGRPVLWAEEGM